MRVFMPAASSSNHRHGRSRTLRSLLWTVTCALLGCRGEQAPVVGRDAAEHSEVGSGGAGTGGSAGDGAGARSGSAGLNSGGSAGDEAGARSGGAGLDSGGSAGAGAPAGGAGASLADAANGSTDANGSADAVSNGKETGTVAAGVRWVGRVDLSDPSKPRFAWSGTGFVAQITGTSLTFTVSNEQDVFFQPVVDHQPGMRLKATAGTASLPVATGLSTGSHLIEVYRETEGQAGISQFVGLSGGTLMPAPGYSGRVIEFIGDSITAGYGDLGSESHPSCGTGTNLCSYTIDTQSEYQDYAVSTARALNADWSVIAKSGWGLVRDNANSTANVLPSVWDRVLFSTKTPAWDFKTKANAVVINLGTNDTAKGAVGASYQTALAAFVDTIRAQYPERWVFVLTGTMLGTAAHDEIKGYIQSVVSAKGGDAGKIAYVDLGAQDSCNKPTGCDWHPSAAEQQRMADLLAPIMKQKLGW